MKHRKEKRVVKKSVASKGKLDDQIQKFVSDKPVSRAILGRIGESAGEYYFKSKGYRVLGRNVRFKRGEVDILAIKDNVIRVIEVKTALVRADSGSGNLSNKTSSDSVSRRENTTVETNFEPELNFTKVKLSKLKSIAAEIMSKYPFPLLHLLDYDVKTGREALVLNDGGEVGITIEGFAVRIFADKTSVKTIKVRHFENLVS